MCQSAWQWEEVCDCHLQGGDLVKGQFHEHDPSVWRGCRFVVCDALREGGGGGEGLLLSLWTFGSQSPTAFSSSCLAMPRPPQDCRSHALTTTATLQPIWT